MKELHFYIQSLMILVALACGLQGPDQGRWVFLCRTAHVPAGCVSVWHELDAHNSAEKKQGATNDLLGRRQRLCDSPDHLGIEFGS